MRPPTLGSWSRWKEEAAVAVVVRACKARSLFPVLGGWVVRRQKPRNQNERQ
jgi:predicted lysophospholipase L1 biosynthesis ABC-type transport system permease subunit